MDILWRPLGLRRGARQGRTAIALVERLERRSLLTLTPIPAALNFIAGVQPSSPVRIGSFLDSVTTAMAGDFTATITWGDGHVSAGTVASTTTAGRFDVDGSNLYLTPNTYPITVAVADYQGDSTTIDSTAYVATPVLTPIGATANFIVGTQPSTPVTIGSFLDSDTSAVQGDFTASITWGDGNTSSGTVTASGTPGLFLVSGTNLYAKAGSFPISIAVQDNLGDSATIKSTGLVAAPTLTPIGATANFATGVQPSTPVTIGSFLDSDTSAAQGDFTASITWGDGNTSSGTVTASVTPGLFLVSGTNLYAKAGSFPISIAVQDNLGDSATIKSTADVTSPVLTPIGATANLTAGVSPTNPVTIGSFLDSNTAAVAGNFTATINWGDGHSSSGTVTAVAGVPGLFVVSGTNLYTAAGTFSVTVAVQDNLGDATTIKSSAVVISPVLTPVGTTTNFIAGVPPSGPVTVGSFFDSGPGVTASQFTASINWGNGNVSAGTVTESTTTPGLFLVSGTNLYTAAGTYSVTVQVQDQAGNTTTIKSSALVTSPTLTPIPASLSFTAGVPPSGPVIVGSFLDSNAGAAASDFTATITWGDGHVSAGTVTESTTTPGLFLVSGTNLYAKAGTYSVSSLVRDNVGDTTIIASTASVSAPVLTPIPTTINLTAGLPPGGPVTVGSFFDSAAGATAGQFTATITWGDGHVSAGTVTESTPTPGLFYVAGTNLYAKPGTYPVSVLVNDNQGDTTTIASTAIVSAPVLVPIPATVYLTAGVLPTSPVTVGSFFDSAAGATAGQFTASINWGDGHVSAGAVTLSSTTPGLFLVSGTNLYAAAGTYTITIAVQDPAGNSATITSTANVLTAPALTPIPATVSFTAGVAPTSPVIVGSFFDSVAGATAGQFTASINWGDGNVSAGTVTESSTTPGLFLVSGSHLYATAGSYKIMIAVQDQTGDSTTINSTAVVLTITTLTPIPATVNFTAGMAPTSPVTVGSFFDSNTNATADQFTASVNWGDGNVSAGTVTASSTTPGLFLVSGSHLYAAAGTYKVTIAVQDQTGDSTTINSTAIVLTITTLTPIPATVSFTTGVLTGSPVTVGSFFDSNTGDTASQFTATINWGDTNVSTGTVTESLTTPGLFLVSGSHLYAAPGNYSVTIVVQDQTGPQTVILSTAIVTSYNASGHAGGLTGGLANVITNGPHTAMGFTNTDRPTFNGTAAPYSIVQVYGRHFNADAELPVGEAVTGGNGLWSLTTGPLAVGTWIFTATVTIPGGYPSNMFTLTNPSGGDLVYIDLTPRLVRWLSYGQKSVPHPKMPIPHPKAPKLQLRGHHKA